MKILIAAGGSGGHIFPAIALAQELEKEEISFVSSRRDLDKNIVGRLNLPSFFLSINSMPFDANPFRWLIFALKFAADIVASMFLLFRLKPDVVVGFGGYSSAPITGCAGVLGIPVIIHEQNIFPGRANTILSKLANRVAISFKETSKHFPKTLSDKIVFTGNPTRNPRKSLPAWQAGVFDPRQSASNNKQTILIMGGSQGSTFLNSVASRAAKIVHEKYPTKYHFVHLTGKKDYENVNNFYAENDISGKVFSFLDGIENAYATCSMAISRAGAAAIFELAGYSVPMILVPYPNPKNSQRANAVYFSDREAATCREEDDLTAASLAEEIVNVLGNRQKWEKMSGAAGRLAQPDAAKRLAQEVIALGK